ncbi:MAG: DUF599 domain-containing protein [Hyphomicrobium sp.]
MPTDLPLPALDCLALVWFVVLVGSYRLIAERGPLQKRSIIGAMRVHRINWMLTMVHRDNRLIDAILLGNLSQGNAFFASTAAISIGGLVGILGYGDRAKTFFESIPHTAEMPPLLWEAKVIFLISIFVFAFFKFAWAFRLTHYLAILIGATPLLEPGNKAVCEAHAHRTAELNAIMAEHSASGLRAFYYAIAALAWFFHPLLFMIASLWVVAILVRRDFFSLSRRAIAGE